MLHTSQISASYRPDVMETTLTEPCPKTHITIRNLSVSYGQQPTISNITLDLYKGCITALIGPSGCGKSSLLSTLNRLIDLVPEAEVSGEILLDGEDIRQPGCNLTTLRRRVGMVFQKPNLFPLSIHKNLLLPLRELGRFSKDETEQRIVTALRDVALWEEVKDRLHSPALALSGGQQQRLCIARALILQPDVLLMDEPCSALDPISSAAIEQLIQRLSGRYTIVIVTHNLAQAKRIANYAAFFWVEENTGKLMEFGQSESLFNAPKQALTASYVSGVFG